jgi:hypothetical protein
MSSLQVVTIVSQEKTGGEQVLDDFGTRKCRFCKRSTADRVIFSVLLRLAGRFKENRDKNPLTEFS